MNDRRLPTVGIVIPCFNGESYIEETLGSVLAQEQVALHVVVVDDGSTDGSAAKVAEFAKSHDRVQLVEQTNAGVAEARNRGLSAVPPAAEAVMFLDADDVVEPDALERLSVALASAPDAVAAVGPHVRIDREGNLLSGPTAGYGAHVLDDRGKVRWADGVAELTWRNFLPGNAVFTPGQCLVRRAALPAEPFDRRFTPAEDWDLWLRLTYDGRMVTVPDPVLRYRDHPAGLSKRYQMMRARRRELLQAHRSACPDDIRPLMDAAYWFVMFRADRRLNLRWARDDLRRGEPATALRYLARAGKLCITELVGRVVNRRTPWYRDVRQPTAQRPPSHGASPPPPVVVLGEPIVTESEASPVLGRIDGQRTP